MIVHQYTTLLFSTERKVNIKPFNLLSQPRISIVNNIKRYEWEDFQVPGALSNKYQPDWVNQYARVQVSDYNNWAEVVDWGLKINPIQTYFTGELADTIAKLKKQAGQDREKYFRSAVTFVQDEIRYMGIETGEYSNKANSPDKVFIQRYGDCKDKSLLLASILNAGGMEARLVLINTDLKDKIEDYIPSTALFNHAIVVANMNGKQVYIDATIGYQRGKGTELYFPPYREGLILKAGNTGLTKIKETKTGKIVCEEKVTTIYTLNQADDIRDRLAEAGMAKTEKNYLDYYAKTFSKIEASDSIVIKDNQEKNELTTVENYTIKNFFKRDSTNGKYTVDFYADYISQQLPNITGEIKTPVAVNYPYAIDYTTTVILANGWDIANEHYSINRDSYKFSYDQTVSDDKLSLRYQFAFFKDYISSDKLSEFKEDVKNLKDDKLSFNLIYTPDIKKVPFELNKLMFFISVLIAGIFVYGGLKVYKTETRDPAFYNSKNSMPQALGGWLIILIIVLIANPLNTIKDLIENDFYSVSKWNLVTTGINSVITRVLLIFEGAGNVALICFSVFCLVLIFKKRDIAARFIKLYYVSMVIFLFIDYFFNAFVEGKSSDYEMEQLIQQVIVAAVWTYYLNVSTRVTQTFVVPYPD